VSFLTKIYGKVPKTYQRYVVEQK